MSYDFNGTTQLLQRNVAPLTAVPLTFACWVKQSSANHALMSIGDKDTDADLFLMFLQGDGSGNAAVTAYVQRGALSARADSSTAISDTQWHHACAVFATNSSRSAYLDGGGKVTNTTLRTPNAGALDSVTVGAIARLTNRFFGSGPIAEPAIWSAALTDAEVAMLAAGASPMFVRPRALYLPMRANEGFRDWIDGLDMSADNGGNDPVADPDHPPVFYPRRARLIGA